MPAPKGHPMWANPIKPKKYTPDSFWLAALKYFEWCKKNPWKKNEAIKSGDKAGKIIKVPTERPYTIEGLCIFLNIDGETFRNYSKREGYEKYFVICSRIKHIIDNQHLEGGYVGAFNPGLVARKLGLQEKQNEEQTNDDTQSFTIGGKEIIF